MAELSLKLKASLERLKNLKISLRSIDPIASNLTTWENKTQYSLEQYKEIGHPTM